LYNRPGDTSYHYINIDASFDEFGALSGTTTVAEYQQIRGHAPTLRGDVGDSGRVSGLIGEKGLIGAFVSTSRQFGRIYLGGFYALNPDARRSEEAGAPTSFGTWENSILQGGSSYAATEEMAATADTPFIPAFPGLVERTVDNFGVGAPDKLARFARLGTDGYIADDGTGNSQALLADFADETVKNNGVGFGRVGNGYYSGLLAGADVGLSLTANQAITPGSLSATWKGKIALYGHGNGLGGNNHAPSFTPQVFSLKVIFDGTGSGDTAGEIIVDSTYQFGASIDTVHPFKLTITDVRFNAAGVITGTTSLFATPGNVQGHAVKGVLTGLIGTRGAIGSFISTGAIGTVAGGITYAGSYAGGFVVQNPDYTVTPEIPVLESGDLGGEVKYAAWTGSFATLPSAHGTLQVA
ncbi:MAG: hypothetical protein K8953_12430, partial [Proteobacteria bacterium]|nr:hypothetical protein [Pseudomonadota bacterium]